ncbi:MAG: ASCH domain-containing protein [Caldilineaceae bacterium]
MHDAIEAFWHDFLANAPGHITDDTPYVAESFGDNPQLADALGALIVQGVKTATCSALWEWEAEGAALPEAGLITIVLDGRGAPLCVIETTEVTIRAFNAVDAQFAFAEGEDDRSLAAWRREHWRYFSRVLPKIGRAPSDDMPLVCERFRVLFPKPEKE